MKNKQVYPKPNVRPLAVYAFDPSVGRRFSNFMTINVPYEDLRPGPIGRKIAVVDYDASNDLWYQPVDLDQKVVLMQGGLTPSESDPRFHQQMVYAVVSETIRRFEFALGREITWHALRGKRVPPQFKRHLRIFPHAFQEENAFYDPVLKALLFGYFRASETGPGQDLPGQTIYTCLSHDVVAHETTHAILDQIRPGFMDSTSPDTPAFHEGFADIVALFQHFSMRDAVIETINRTGGLLYKDRLRADAEPSGKPVIGAELTEANPLVGLAQQFGESIGMRSALRSALGSKPDPELMKTVFEPHDRGAILVAAVFDAYFSIYLKRIQDLLRIGRAGGAISASGDLHPDLASRLCDEAVRVAGNFLTICIRAIDYCPALDVQFGEFLRAAITADSDLVPDDPHGYRAEVILAFKRRGILPEDVVSLSEDSLRWDSTSDGGRKLPPCKDLIFDMLRETDDRAVGANKKATQSNYRTLHAYATRNARLLGLSTARGTKIAVRSFYPLKRVGPDGQSKTEFVVAFLQQRKLPIDPKNPKAGTFIFRGGSTVILDHRGEVRYVIYKHLDSKKRQNRARDFLAHIDEVAADAPFQARPLGEPVTIAAIHRGLLA